MNHRPYRDADRTLHQAERQMTEQPAADYTPQLLHPAPGLRAVHLAGQVDTVLQGVAAAVRPTMEALARMRTRPLTKEQP